MCRYMYTHVYVYGRDALLAPSSLCRCPCVVRCYLVLFGVIWGTPAVPRCPRAAPARSGDRAGGGAGGSRGPVLPPRRCTNPLGHARAAGTVGSSAGEQTPPFAARSSRVSGKLRQPRCLPRHPFLLLSLWQRREDNRQHFCLCGWRRRKDY